MAIFHQLVSVETEDGPMPMYIAAPEGPGPFPTVLVACDQSGPHGTELNGVERLAQHGYAAATPELFHRFAPLLHSRDEQMKRRGELTDPQVITSMNAALSYLQSQPFIQGDNMGIIGFCMGGRVAYLMATLRPELRAAVDCYGGGVFNGSGRPAPFEATADFHCPILILHGEQDPGPSPEDVRKTSEELTRHGKLHDTHCYPDVGHGFMSRGPSDVVEDAWERSLNWFDRYLVREPAAVRA